ncbi:MAG: protein-glutamate O-methyltransferase CheR [Bacillota bacterium]|nr:protein-glutamate O-methyltransferase CheR [Bacillota bacterium]
MEFGEFCEEIRGLTGLDLCQYRPQQIERRLGGLLARQGVADWTACLELLRQEPARREEFVEWVTIGVSEFFRNPDRFEELRGQHLPALIEAAGPDGLRAWSAGCADGPEPYSVAMLIEQLDPAGFHRVLATDIDRQGLRAGEAGLYGEEAVRGVDTVTRDRFFRRRSNRWEVVPAVRSRVTFRYHDLFSPVYPHGFHLVLCRNVLIYFEDGTKQAVLGRLAQAVLAGGLLFLGATEMVRDPRSLGLRYLSPCFYRREG